MFAGMLQFYFAQGIFGEVGKKPVKTESKEVTEDPSVKRNPFTAIDKIFIAASALIGLVWIINDPMSKIAGTDVFAFEAPAIGRRGHNSLGNKFMFLSHALYI